MNLVFQQIQQVAKVDSSVLIEGETGTGKELVARAIHFSSRRKQKPFIAVNCAGLTDSILGSQLFGHKKGAFTGAIEDQQGVFEAAEGGALLLDEIGGVSPNVQASLLRVLQEREITRLGESKPKKIDVRVLVATHHNLSQDVLNGAFRADLLYRIRVARIQLPPLRERREDIPLLVASFLEHGCVMIGKSVHDVSSEAMGILMDYMWPGNVRELKSAIECALIRCDGPVIEANDFPSEILEASGLRFPADSQEKNEKTRLVSALQSVRGNREAAARLLGISRATLYRRLAELKSKSDR
jgi:DNA-binding NtrC family response regulator